MAPEVRQHGDGARGVAGEAAGAALRRAAESGFLQAELGVIGEAQSIATSPRMIDLAAAHGAGEPMTVNIVGRLVQYEPRLPASGMTDQTINVAGANGRTIPVTTIWRIGPDGVPRFVTALPRSK